VHDIDLEPGSRLAEAMGVTRASCSSHHHQAVERAGDGLRVTARAPDGVVEGVELDGDAWIVGAQWHPEDTAADDPAQQRLFDAFVRQAAKG
jgi:putative glutamine amidotransferase